MSCEEEVISVRKQLERMSKEGGDQTQALDLLKALGKLPINLQVLTNTRCSCFWALYYSGYTDATFLNNTLQLKHQTQFTAFMKVLHSVAMRWFIK